MTNEIENIVEKSFMRTFKSITELSLNVRDVRGYLEKYYQKDTKFLYEFDKELRELEKKLLNINMEIEK